MPIQALCLNESEQSSSDSELDEQIIFTLCTLTSAERQQQSRMRTGVSGRQYITELLSSGHPRRCFEVLRMSLPTFEALKLWLETHASLTCTNRHDGMTIEEKIVIFLHIVARNASSRDCCERFSRGPEAISKYTITTRTQSALTNF